MKEDKMRKAWLVILYTIFVGLFCNQKMFSQETVSKEIIEGYINILKEKEIMGKTDDGRQAAPGVIIDDANFLYLPQGIAIFLPVIAEAADLLYAIGDLTHRIYLGNCSWDVWYDSEKNVIAFRDTGM
jgi:hypothetical protein